MHTWVGVAVAVGFFLLFFFGDIFTVLPRIFVFDIFGNTIASSRSAAVAYDFSSGGAVPPTPVGPDAILDHLSPPADPALAGSVGILDIVTGEGTVAEKGNAVQVGYVGSYIEEGTGKNVVFDSNTDPDTALSFTIGAGSLIPGFEGGVVGMREGGQRLVRIEPESGYGDEANGPIPANTTLFFVIELYGVK